MEDPKQGLYTWLRNTYYHDKMWGTKLAPKNIEQLLKIQLNCFCHPQLNLISQYPYAPTCQSRD